MPIKLVNGQTPLKERYRMFVINQHNISPGGLPTDGLIHHWPLHAIKTDLIAGKNWLATGAETYGTNRKGEANKAAVFVDNTTYFQLASDLTIGTVFSVSFWFYGVIQAPMILNKWSTGCISFFNLTGRNTDARLATENILFQNAVGKFNLDNTWYNFVLTRENNSFSLYRNNSLVESKLSATNANMIIRTLNKRYASTDNLYALNGKLSDVRIYNRVLTADEITALYNE